MNNIYIALIPYSPLTLYNFVNVLYKKRNYDFVKEVLSKVDLQ